MATTTASNSRVIYQVAKELSLFFEVNWPDVKPQVALAIALDGDRSNSIITAAHTRTVARVALIMLRVALSNGKSEFRKRVSVRAVELLKQALNEEGGVDEIRIRACLVAELRRVRIVEEAVFEEAISYVALRDAGICEEMRRRSVGDLTSEESIQVEGGICEVCKELWVKGTS
ncbi:hypothetical protein DFP72DRAFT_862118 [Ephemerocybe angulata]|uniref:Uncharacterized protein n=1 Tax=Ephemerocybe angulata TaxID=980116 RepID=A0A8H6H928_9AGAR|nr:hypothetical protein DFP72DRAFT_862118 [Tulosesus angulatus]